MYVCIIYMYICIYILTVWVHFFHNCSLGHGIPNQRAHDRRTGLLDPALLPIPPEAVAHFHSTGGRLHLFSNFGNDALDGRSDSQQMRYQAFTERFPTFEPIYYRLLITNVPFFSNLYFSLLTLLKGSPVQSTLELYHY